MKSDEIARALGSSRIVPLKAIKSGTPLAWEHVKFAVHGKCSMNDKGEITELDMDSINITGSSDREA